MRATVLVRVGIVCLAGIAGTLSAQDFSRLSEAERKQVNDWMAERVEHMIAANKLENELSRAWTLPTNTSPEIEVLRKRCMELQQQLADAQAELKQKVLELPALQEKQKTLAQERQSIQDLTKKVKEKTDGVK